MKYRATVSDEKQMLALGSCLGRGLTPGNIVYLEGDLGSGKTTFARGILEGLDCPDWIVSPTYTLVEEYQVPLCKVYHLDLYRLGDPEEVEGMGIRDWQDGQSILLIEWPENGFGKLPHPQWRVQINCPKFGRAVLLEGPHTVDALEAFVSS
tara:strand:- start:854 stop:1309 length:456 start_codon:yes stop_codon:yes gene_type:complete